MDEEDSSKVSWPMVYGIAIFLDFIGLLTVLFGVGLFINRVLTIIFGPTLALWFYASGIKHWGWKILLGGGAEEVPIVGDFLPLWTVAIWRIKKANVIDTAEEYAENNLMTDNYQEQQL